MDGNSLIIVLAVVGLILWAVSRLRKNNRSRTMGDSSHYYGSHGYEGRSESSQSGDWGGRDTSDSGSHSDSGFAWGDSGSGGDGGGDGGGGDGGGGE